jgi:hypothetical protein
MSNKELLEVGDRLISSRGDIITIDRVTKTKAVVGRHEIKRERWSIDTWVAWGKFERWSRPMTYKLWTQEEHNSIMLNRMCRSIARSTGDANGLQEKYSEEDIKKIYHILEGEE